MKAEFCLKQFGEAGKRKPNRNLAQKKTSLERQIAVPDAQIDRLVYELYGLTEEEIKIVEGV